jgi:hypothetical protein
MAALAAKDLPKYAKMACDEFIENMGGFSKDAQKQALVYVNASFNFSPEKKAADDELADSLENLNLTGKKRNSRSRGSINPGAYQKLKVEEEEEEEEQVVYELPPELTPSKKALRQEKGAKEDLNLYNFGGVPEKKWLQAMKAKSTYIHYFDPVIIKSHKDNLGDPEFDVPNAPGFGNPTLKHVVQGSAKEVDGVLTWVNDKGKPYDADPFYYSQKYDGMRGIWHPEDECLYSRKGNPLENIPDEFYEKFPKDCALDGELYVEGLTRSEIAAFFQHPKKDQDWSKAKYYIFDVPSSPTSFEINIVKMKDVARKCDSIEYIPQIPLGDVNILNKMYDVTRAGYEGLMIRNGSQKYDHCPRSSRSEHIIKAKPRYESEGTITKITKTQYKLNKLSGDRYEEIPAPKTDITVTRRKDRGLKVGDRIQFTYQGIKEKSGKPDFPAFKQVISRK